MSADIETTILAMAAKPGGFAAKPLGSLGISGINKRLKRLAAEGKLFKAKISSKCVRWHTTKEDADNHVARAHNEVALRFEAKSRNKPVLKDQGGPVQYHPDFKGVQRLAGYERHENRFGSAGAVSFGSQRGRVTR